MVDKQTGEAAPVTAFLNGDRIATDIQKVNDAARGRFLSVLGMALALARNYDPFKTPTHFRFLDLLKKFDKTFGQLPGPPSATGAWTRIAPLPIFRSAGPIAGIFCSLQACGSRIFSITIFAAPSSASSLCDAARRNQLLRLQHRRGLAQHRRKNAHDRHPHQVVRGARSA